MLHAGITKGLFQLRKLHLDSISQMGADPWDFSRPCPGQPYLFSRHEAPYLAAYPEARRRMRQFAEYRIAEVISRLLRGTWAAVRYL